MGKPGSYNFSSHFIHKSSVANLAGRVNSGNQTSHGSEVSSLSNNRGSDTAEFHFEREPTEGHSVVQVTMPGRQHRRRLLTEPIASYSDLEDNQPSCSSGGMQQASVQMPQQHQIHHEMNPGIVTLCVYVCVRACVRACTCVCVCMLH